MNRFLKYATLYQRERALDKRIAKLREERAKLRQTGPLSSSFNTAADASRADLILDIPLAEYLTAYGEAEVPTRCTYQGDKPINDLDLDAGRVEGVFTYFQYSARWVGTVPKSCPPLHVWVRAQTRSHFTPATPADLAQPVEVPS